MRAVFYVLIVVVILAWCVIYSLSVKVDTLTRHVAVLVAADSILLCDAEAEIQELKDDSVLQAQVAYHSYMLYRHANKTQRAKLNKYRRYWDKEEK